MPRTIVKESFRIHSHRNGVNTLGNFFIDPSLRDRSYFSLPFRRNTGTIRTIQSRMLPEITVLLHGNRPPANIALQLITHKSPPGKPRSAAGSKRSGADSETCNH